MKRATLSLFAIAIACALGIVAAELLLRVPSVKSTIRREFGRTTTALIAENLREVSANERVDKSEVNHALDLLRWQFEDDSVFHDALRDAGLDQAKLRSFVREHLQSRQWVERQIAPALRVGDNEGRAYFDLHREEFAQSRRLRARHIFLAAHAATPPEKVEAQRKQIAELAARLQQGEDFALLAAQTSEDEGTKRAGGDLGWFTAARTPPEFFAVAEKLRVGETSLPFRSHLGFHIAQGTGEEPARDLDFNEARSEIALRLMHQQRSAAVMRVTERLSSAELIRAD